jgi:hypothetical protein
MLNRTAALALLIFSAVFAQCQSKQILLGVLEDLPGHYAGDPNFRAVRVIFQKRGGVWEALPTHCSGQSCLKTLSSEYPREVTWTICFDGNNLGQVTARTQQAFRYYSEVGLQDITNRNSIPTIGSRLRDYSGFLEKPVFRPLIADSEPYFRDPDAWKPAQLPAETVTALRREFRRKFPKLCRETKPESGTLQPFPYRDEEVALTKAYGSRTGWAIAELHLEAIDCSDVEAGFDIEDPWFAIDPNKSVKYLDSGMWLVDAGDYDNDRSSELVFSIDRYNRGGYELFYNDFKKSATFEFSYH